MINTSSYRKDNNISSSILPLCLAILVSWQLLGAVTPLPTIFYAIILFAISFIIILQKQTLYFPVVIFIIYIIFNILICNPDPVFQSWQRFFGFCSILLTVSPLLQSNFSREFRGKGLYYILIIITILSVGSFFAFFLGINYYSKIYTDERSLTTFAGFTHNPMILGPISGLSILFLLYLFTIKTQKRRYLLIIPLICAIGSLLFAASRGAFVATIVSSGVMLYIIARHKKKILKYTIILVTLIFATAPIWRQAMTGMIYKQRTNISIGGAYGSRTDKWTNRIIEFKDSPIIGIGFSSVDQSIERISQNGEIETGSSWLSILSMLGIIGFTFFLLIYYNAIKSVISNQKVNIGEWHYRLLLLGLIIFFSIHLIIEGYLFAIGSPLCLIFWLSIGCSTDMRYKEFSK